MFVTKPMPEKRISMTEASVIMALGFFFVLAVLSGIGYCFYRLVF